MGNTFGILWGGLGVVGGLILLRKGYLNFFRLVGDLGCFAWLLYGWAAAIVVVVFGLGIPAMGGPITLLLAWKLPSRHLSDHVPTGSYTPRNKL